MAKFDLTLLLRDEGHQIVGECGICDGVVRSGNDRALSGVFPTRAGRNGSGGKSGSRVLAFAAGAGTAATAGEVDERSREGRESRETEKKREEADGLSGR